MTRRILSIWAPNFSAERIARRQGDDPDETPWAVVDAREGALRLVGLSAAAAAQNLRAGQALADARAISPALRTQMWRAAQEAAAREALRRWALRYSPWAADDADPQDASGAAALRVDVTGCAHFYGGEAGLLADVVDRLARMGVRARAAVAGTIGAAWAAARFIAEPTRTLSADVAADLAALPPEALRLPQPISARLKELGFRSIAQIEALPRAALSRRFGTTPGRRLDQVFGRTPEPLAPQRAAAHFAARMSFPEPIARLEDLEEALARLAAALCARLEAADLGARRLHFAVERVDRRISHVELRFAQACRDPARMRALLQSRLPNLDVGFGLDAARLWAAAVETLTPRQTHAGPSSAETKTRQPPSNQAFEDYLGRLSDRLGVDRVLRYAPLESHAPDAAWRLRPALESDDAPGRGPTSDAEPLGARPKTPNRKARRARDESAKNSVSAELSWVERARQRPHRPLILLPLEPVAPIAPISEDQQAPTDFAFRGRRYHVQASIGPERIAPEWWAEMGAWRSGVRDYWRVQTREGPRFWLAATPQAPISARWWAAGLDP